MTTTKRRSLQLSVAAVAALAIFAVAAVMLLAGSTPAQATTAALTPDDGAAQPRPQQTDKTPTAPRHAPPEPCPGETGNPNKAAADVVASGHIALFDVWWNPVELELTNSSCPPTVAHTRKEKLDQDGEPTGEYIDTDKRSPSSIDIAKTVIHIPNTARINLNADDNPYTETKYEELWDADAKENRDTDDDDRPNEGEGDRKVWALPACPPDGTAAADDLCIIFSAALLNPNDWKAGTEIEYLLDHVHQTDIDKQDPRYTLAYDKNNRLLWDSSDVQRVEMSVAPGEYKRPTLFFTDRGTYELQVHIRGEPNHATNRDDGLKPVSKDNSVSSDVREYIIHVGALADLSVTAAATPQSPEPTDNVTVAITASNGGPDAVPQTNVNVTLPPELTYVSHEPASAGFADADGDGVRTWDAGSLASGATNTLAITAKVAPETHGRELAVKAAISGTEPAEITETNDQGDLEIKDYNLPVLDPNPHNDTAAATITVSTTGHNTNPMLMVIRSVEERSAPGTKVGDPVGVKEPNTSDTLRFTLTGEGNEQFTTTKVSDGVQIEVADGANLDYEVKPVYDLVLAVSDGKDTDSNDDDYKVDDTIKVQIRLIDIVDAYSATLSVDKTAATVGETVTLSVAIQNPPVPINQLHRTIRTLHRNDIDLRQMTGPLVPFERSQSVAGTYTYYMNFWQPDGSNLRHRIETNRVKVIWSASD